MPTARAQLRQLQARVAAISAAAESAAAARARRACATTRRAWFFFGKGVWTCASVACVVCLCGARARAMLAQEVCSDSPLSSSIAQRRKKNSQVVPLSRLCDAPQASVRAKHKLWSIRSKEIDAEMGGGEPPSKRPLSHALTSHTTRYSAESRR